MDSKLTEHKLSFEGVTFNYNGITALSDISLAVDKGSLAALIGPNGSGKTTLLKVAAGLLSNYEGFIKIYGKEVSSLSPSERSKLVSFTPSGADFPFEFSVRDVVSQGRSPHLDLLGNLSEKDEEIINKVIEKLSLSGYENRSVNCLSQGEAERVIIARHLAQDAPIMLFDESFAHLDLKHRLSLVDELHNLKDQGKIIIVAIHEIEFAARFFPRVIIMCDGKIVTEGSREDAIKNNTLSDAYDLDFKIINRENPTDITIIPSKKNKNRDSD